MDRFIGFFRLTRPANIVTAVSDILAGVAIAGFLTEQTSDYAPVLWLVLATIGLYGGGVVLNDVFDAELDATERPERPIPSGLISVGEAARLAVFLLVLGVFSAYLVSQLSGVLAFTTAVAVVVYNKWSKHNAFFGPLNMGLCRGLNLVLGISCVSAQVSAYWYLGFVPVVYIAAITMISRGEVHGGRRSTLYVAAALYLVAMACIVGLSWVHGHIVVTMIFILAWAFMVFLPLREAVRIPEARMLARSVRAGVLALILMNAAWAAAFGAIYLAVVIVLLLPFSLALARVFAVT